MNNFAKLVVGITGLALVAVGVLSGVQNFKVGTLDHQENLMAVLGTLLCGAALLHNRDGLAAILSAWLPQSKQDDQKSGAAGYGPAARTSYANPFSAIVEKMSDSAGRFLSSQTELRDNEAIYHLAVRAEKINNVEQRQAVLSLLRNVNDELFVMHHDVEGSKSNASKSSSRSL